MMEFYNNRVLKARKHHRCVMCHKTISVGETYWKEVGKYNGDFFERKMHSDCYDMFNMILSDRGETEFTWDDFPDWWIENRCYICELRHPICIPDKNCSYSPDECCFKIEGRCIASDDCNDITHIGWCEGA